MKLNMWTQGGSQLTWLELSGFSLCLFNPILLKLVEGITDIIKARDALKEYP